MRQLFVLALVLSLGIIANAQVKLPATKENTGKSFTMPPAINDLNTTSESVTNQLSSKLGLDADQKTNAFGAVKEFLEAKTTILGLAKTDQADYTSQFSGMQSGLFTQLKTIVGETKYANFLKLKPAAGSTGNAMNHLFY